MVIIWLLDDRHIIVIDDLITAHHGDECENLRYLTYMDLKNMHQNMHTIVLHHSGYGNSNMQYTDYLSPRHTGRRPCCDHGDLRNPPDRRVVARYQKNAPLCDCNRDRAALARRSGARPLWAQLRFHYNLCVSTTLIPLPHGSLDTRSVWPSATLQRCYYDIGNSTTLLGRSHRVCCAHTALVLRSYGDHLRFTVYLAPFLCKL